MTALARGQRLALPVLLVLAAALSSCGGPPTTPSTAAGSPEPTPTRAAPRDDRERALDLADRYEHAVASADAASAWSLVSPAERVNWPSLQAFADERAAFTASTHGEYTLGQPSSDAAQIGFWRPPTAGNAIDSNRAFVIEVDFPRLGDNNSGYEILLVAPDDVGSWWVWVVR
jgi:hypothetical protein